VAGLGSFFFFFFFFFFFLHEESGRSWSPQKEIIMSDVLFRHAIECGMWMFVSPTCSIHKRNKDE
jgi:hypothetical protein